MKAILTLCLSLFLASCTLLEPRKQHRELQTKIIQQISEKTPQFQRTIYPQAVDCSVDNSVEAPVDNSMSQKLYPQAGILLLDSCPTM